MTKVPIKIPWSHDVISYCLLQRISRATTRCRRIGMGCVSACGDGRDALGPPTNIVKLDENIKTRSTNTNQTLGPSNLGSSDKTTRTPQVSVNRCGRHVVHCPEHRTTYLPRADFIVNPVTGLFTEKDRRAWGHAQKLAAVHVPIVLPQVHQLDNLSFGLLSVMNSAGGSW